MNLIQLSATLDEILGTRAIPDSSLNGIQVENTGEIRVLASAVDASVETVMKAAEAGAQALLVHHGFLWKNPVAIGGRHYRLVKMLMDHNMGLIAQHLPLDVHPEFGNNALMAEALGLPKGSFFGQYHGVPIIHGATFPQALDFEALCARVEQKFGKILAAISGGKPSVEKVALCSGGGGFGLEDAARWGADVFVTGDANHVMYHLARELGVNVICAGHYATETLGVKAVAAHLSARGALEARFIDVPTGL